MEHKPTNPPRKPTKKRELANWIERTLPDRVGEPEWDELNKLLAPISESYLRRLLRESGIPLAPLVEGVRQESFDALETSLITLLAEYEQSDKSRKAIVRRLVIEAKDHARLASRHQEGNADKKAEKDEMALWMLTWLESPSVFPQWVALRRAALEGR